MKQKWECFGFDFPRDDEGYSDSVVKAVIDMHVVPAHVSKTEADLISAAPALLEACEVARASLAMGVGRTQAFATLTAAINLAKGGGLPAEADAAP